MKKQNVYEIDEKILNDIKCDLHDIPKSYTKYCRTCHKNLCNWCIGHKGYDLIDLSSIESSPENYKTFEENLNQMRSINVNFFTKTLSAFIKKRDEIQKMLNDINLVISDINKTSKFFGEQLKFNETIFNAYKNDKINYFVLKNFNEQNFILDVKFFKQKWNLNKSKFKESEEENEEELTRGYKNMWISDKYCKHWGLREAIREFIQNQHDGIISKILTKNNLQVIKMGKRENINNSKVYLNFNFVNKQDNKIYGKIRFDQLNNILVISNEGLLWLGDFLLGGSKDENNNSDLIGTFGEGMKLAILALCRLNKTVTIISSNKIYSFLIKEDKLFLKDNQPQRCMHFKYETIEDNDEDNIKVIIRNINIYEWGSQIINFLWLLDDDAEIYTSYDNSNNKLGQLLSEEYLREKIYVKGIFVQKVKKFNDQKKNNCLGFNVDLQLDRDRNHISDTYELKNTITSIISFFCNKNIKTIKEKNKEKENERKKHSKNRSQSSLKINTKNENNKTDKEKNNEINYEKAFGDIIEIIKDDNIDLINSYTLANSLSQEMIDYIWNEIYLAQDKKKYPVYRENDISKFILSKNLSNDFYPYFIVNYNLMNILEKSKNYLSIKDKFSLYVKNAINIEPKGNYKNALNEVYSKVKIMDKSFDGNSVEFKKFEKEDKDFCYYDKDKINFSWIKLYEPINNSWKFWIFVKILQFLK